MDNEWRNTLAACLVIALSPPCDLSASDENDALAAVHDDRLTPVVKFGAEPFPLGDVRLLDGPLRHALELDHAYLLSLDPDRLLHSFRIQAGLPSTAKPYGG